MRQQMSVGKHYAQLEHSDTNREKDDVLFSTLGCKQQNPKPKRLKHERKTVAHVS